MMAMWRLTKGARATLISEGLVVRRPPVRHPITLTSTIEDEEQILLVELVVATPEPQQDHALEVLSVLSKGWCTNVRLRAGLAGVVRVVEDAEVRALRAVAPELSRGRLLEGLNDHIVRVSLDCELAARVDHAFRERLEVLDALRLPLVLVCDALDDLLYLRHVHEVDLATVILVVLRILRLVVALGIGGRSSARLRVVLHDLLLHALHHARDVALVQDSLHVAATLQAVLEDRIVLVSEDQRLRANAARKTETKSITTPI